MKRNTDGTLVLASSLSHKTMARKCEVSAVVKFSEVGMMAVFASDVISSNPRQTSGQTLHKRDRYV